MNVMNENMTQRLPMTEIGWFQKNNQLAIADIVFIENIGFCSHQPKDDLPRGKHRVVDLRGLPHIIETECLFNVTAKERAFYWRNAKWTR